MEGPAERIAWEFWKLALPFFQEGALGMTWRAVAGEFLLGFACEQIGAVLMGESWTEGEGGKRAVFALCPQCSLGEGRFPWALFLLRLHKDFK